MAKRGFNLENVAGSFESGIIGEKDVSLVGYISGYREICKLFPELGFIFKFVEQDITHKLNALDHCVPKERAENEEVSISELVEKEAKSGSDYHHIHNSIALIRLHRGLEFVVRLIKDISEASDDRGMGGLSQKAYEETLGKHHPWLVRKGVKIALLTLPTRKQLLPIFMNGLTMEAAQEAVKRTIESGKEVHSRMDNIFIVNKLDHISQY